MMISSSGKSARKLLFVALEILAYYLAVVRATVDYSCNDSSTDTAEATMLVLLFSFGKAERLIAIAEGNAK